VLAGSVAALQAKNIVIATGGQSSNIPIPGAEHAITSDQVPVTPHDICAGPCSSDDA